MMEHPALECLFFVLWPSHSSKGPLDQKKIEEKIFRQHRPWRLALSRPLPWPFLGAAVPINLSNLVFTPAVFA
jgi:hypothetical protein